MEQQESWNYKIKSKILPCVIYQAAFTDQDIKSYQILILIWDLKESNEKIHF